MSSEVHTFARAEVTIHEWPLAARLLACPTCSGQGNRHGLGCATTKHRPELERELVAGMRPHELEALREFRVLERRDDGDRHYLLECTARGCPVFFLLRVPEPSPVVLVFESAHFYRGKAIGNGETFKEYRSTGLCPGDWVRLANHAWEHRKNL
jgi:hypothetical protein